MWKHKCHHRRRYPKSYKIISNTFSFYNTIVKHNLIILYDAGKELNDPRILTDVGDVPVQELRDCGIDDDRLMNIISESVKLVMEEVSHFILWVFLICA